ncbi:DUF4097 family beta strand repeat-containing protein [Nonomuraea sp. NPDC050547]|uniref:DUF4097 family beta strand repeat-containing protein n=1 Tax=Nonomuraea sp. NPDC050547 TaxID=3364368 RepID=UPI0037A17386
MRHRSSRVRGVKAFNTPKPIQAVIDVAAGDVRVEAERRADTRIRVNPLDPADDDDATAAGLAEVAFAGGRLRVSMPRPRRSGAIEVKIQLPEGSDLAIDLSAGRVRALGRLGETRIHTAQGAIQLDQTARLDVESGSGEVDVAAVEGPAVITMGAGDLCLGEAAGGLRVTTGRGRVEVGRAHSDVEITAADGDIVLGEVARGSVTLVASGRVEVGVRRGSGARLSLDSTYGAVRNLLKAWPPPEESVEIHASAVYGDVVVRPHVRK